MFSGLPVLCKKKFGNCCKNMHVIVIKNLILYTSASKTGVLNTHLSWSACAHTHEHAAS